MNPRLLLLLPWLLNAGPLLHAQSPERFPWLADLDHARLLAAVQEKPLLIVFRCEP